MRSLIFISLVSLAGCVDSATTEAPSSPNQLHGDGKADGNAGPLWAGLTSVTLEHYTSDPCDNDQNQLGDTPVVYDEGTRERASVRNICFQVWQPGVTDTDNPDYWQLLDVEVHYRYGTTGDFKQAYVSSIGRAGNNRRYAWALDTSLDPLEMAASLATMPVPFHIDSENTGAEPYADIDADLEFYFTVNGEVLNSPSQKSFDINYQGSVRESSLAPSASGYVLYPMVTCTGLRVGTGAGFFAADITDPAAVAALGVGLDGSLIYGPPTGKSTDGTTLSIVLDNETPVAGQALGSFIALAGAKFSPNGTTLDLALAVYDRASQTTRSLTASFDGCAATP